MAIVCCRMVFGFAFLFTAVSSAAADPIGEIICQDATKLTTKRQVSVGDVIQLWLTDKPNLTIHEVTECTSPNSFRKIGVVKTKGKFIATFVAEKPADTSIAFSYKAAASAGLTVTIHKFTIVSLPSIGRLIELTADGKLVEVESELPPSDGVKVGDVIKFKVGKGDILGFNWGIRSGSALKKGTAVCENDTVVLYFSADRPGVSTFFLNYRSKGAGANGFSALGGVGSGHTVALPVAVGR